MSTDNHSNNATLNQYQENNLSETQITLNSELVGKLGLSNAYLYSYLHRLTLQKGFCYASTEYLANNLSLPLRTIEKGLKDLESMGWIFRNTWQTEGGKRRHIITKDNALGYLSWIEKPNIPNEVKQAFFKFCGMEKKEKKLRPNRKICGSMHVTAKSAGTLNNTTYYLKKAKARLPAPPPLSEKEIKNKLVKLGYDLDTVQKVYEIKRDYLETKATNPFKVLKIIFEKEEHHDIIARDQARREAEERGKQEQLEKEHRKKVGRELSFIAKGEPSKFERVDIQEHVSLIQVRGENGFRRYKFDDRGIESLKKLLAKHKVSLKEISNERT